MYLVLWVSVLLAGCGNHSSEHHHHGDANAHMHQATFEELVSRFEGKERDNYQQPKKVVAYLGDVKGKKIIDIGAGTGYFSFRLAEAGAFVIAADVDERFLDYMRERKAKLGIATEQINVRKVPYDSPNLADAEVDKAIIVNTYHHIEDRSTYFAKVKKGLKASGELIVIDFFKKKLPVGPPLKMKIAEEQIEKELRLAGFTDFIIEKELLPHQYIIRAK